MCEKEDIATWDRAAGESFLEMRTRSDSRWALVNQPGLNFTSTTCFTTIGKITKLAYFSSTVTIKSN